MNAFEFSSGERALFVFTHPDDELVLAALIRRLVRSSTPIHVCWTHSTPIRERESREVFSLLGARGTDLTFFDAPDGRVLESIPILLPPMREKVASFAPTRMYVNAFEQGHIDHDATNLLVNLCFDGQVFEAPLYHSYLQKVPVLNRFSSTVGEQVIDLTDEEIALKKLLVSKYPSQTVRRNMALYSALRLLSLKKPKLYETERARLQTHKDFLKPSHSPKLSQKIEACATWRRWVGAVRPLLTSSSSD